MATKIDEDFLDFESKVNQIMKILEDLQNVNKMEGEPEKEVVKAPLPPDDVLEDTFIVTVGHDRSLINKRQEEPGAEKSSDTSIAGAATLDQFTFMKQLEEDADERTKVRREREKIAQNFRKVGNEAFRKMKYEKAIIMYTKAIEHVKDSPILYNNRSLCYIKLKNFKRAIIDSDYVLNKLDEKNIRSWLYRAAAFWRLGDMPSYESSISYAKKHNTKKLEYIEEFIMKMKTAF